MMNETEFVSEDIVAREIASLAPEDVTRIRKAAQRWRAQMLCLWKLCPKAACRKARACSGDPDFCVERFELLVSDGWAVTGAARSQSTLDGVSAAGALALEADVRDPASVYGVLEQAAAAHGGVDLVVNAASAYGGDRSGPFGGGPIAEAAPDAFDSWAAAPARSAFSFLSAGGRFAVAQGRPATLVQVTGTSVQLSAADGDIYDWALTWDQWQAIAVPA